MPVPARSAVSEMAQVMPAAPRSWRPSTRPPSISSRLASMSSFSANGSPTCTVGRLAPDSSPKVALASTDAPPIPSRPVAEPKRTARLPGPGAAARGQVALLEDADGHDVDQRVLRVARMEDKLAADRRHAHAVAVAADPADHAAHQVAGPRRGRIAEAERIEDGDRSGAHREDVAQDAADAGGGALVRLDGARVVVRLELERHGQAVADADHAGVLARARHHAGAGGRERPQQRPAALVRAVLAPHHAEHGELEVVRVAAEAGADGVQLLVGEAERAVERRRFALGDGHQAGTPTRRGVAEAAAAAARRGTLDERAEEQHAVVRAEQRLGGTLRVRHQAADVAALVDDARDVARRAVGVALGRQRSGRRRRRVPPARPAPGSGRK